MYIALLMKDTITYEKSHFITVAREPVGGILND